jgi:hypothetical protein
MQKEDKRSFWTSLIISRHFDLANCFIYDFIGFKSSPGSSELGMAKLERLKYPDFEKPSIVSFFITLEKLKVDRLDYREARYVISCKMPIKEPLLSLSGQGKRPQPRCSGNL